MKENGYMTIYLALTLGVMISLCLALIEGCRYRGICLETECVMDIGMDSILAEYHRELFDQYRLFLWNRAWDDKIDRRTPPGIYESQFFAGRYFPR